MGRDTEPDPFVGYPEAAQCIDGVVDPAIVIDSGIDDGNDPAATLVGGDDPQQHGWGRPVVGREAGVDRDGELAKVLDR